MMMMIMMMIMIIMITPSQDAPMLTVVARDAGDGRRPHVLQLEQAEVPAEPVVLKPLTRVLSLLLRPQLPLAGVSIVIKKDLHGLPV